MKKVKASQYRTSALFDCRDCVKNWQDLATSRAKAYQHAKNTGHFVTGEIATDYHYQGYLTLPKQENK